jgi:hypothetical protein
MTSTSDHLLDCFLPTVPADAQDDLARRVQRVFTDTLQRSLDSSAPITPAALDAIVDLLKLSPSAAEESALVLFGLDQWGLAYGQAFGTDCLPVLTAVVAHMRAQSDDATLDHLQTLADDEGAGFQFKLSLRGAIHLGLWHAMVGEVDDAQGKHLAQCLGSQMLALLDAMPQHGWEILARTFAEIQMRCLAHGIAQTGPAKLLNEALFAALHARIPAEKRTRIIAAADQWVATWQAQPATRQ